MTARTPPRSAAQPHGTSGQFGTGDQHSSTDPHGSTGQHGTVHTVVASPIGALTLVATDGVLSGLFMERQRHLPSDEVFGQPDAAPFDEAMRQLHEYFDGGRTQFDLPIALSGSPFQVEVWLALRDIPYGETISYGELAGRIGRPKASRAVGLANGRNPISIVVPCHRVVGADGSLTGYGGGMERKQYLLGLEQSGRRPQ
ncbi:MAG: methylated-DNA (protein)-cysteine S-methyltransferase [Acidimicrobiaceae bacterium]|jgi:methylated-DNA-[protein]-cysteine S-methyltransferase|nr:methylated-DNA (protein)-cysteine S-methyltransferase [Acidimicrobiaceae bacterium]